MISIHLIYKIIPVPVFWTDRFLKEWQGGASFGIFCVIRPKYKEDQGLLEHELTHCKQFYRTLTMWSYLYKFSSKYRLASEVEAYKNQLKYYAEKDANIEWMAEAIAEKYGLSVSVEQAKIALM